MADSAEGWATAAAGWPAAETEEEGWGAAETAAAGWVAAATGGEGWEAAQGWEAGWAAAATEADGWAATETAAAGWARRRRRRRWRRRAGRRRAGRRDDEVAGPNHSNRIHAVRVADRDLGVAEVAKHRGRAGQEAPARAQPPCELLLTQQGVEHNRKCMTARTRG